MFRSDLRADDADSRAGRLAATSLTTAQRAFADMLGEVLAAAWTAAPASRPQPATLSAVTEPLPRKTFRHRRKKT